MTRAKKRTHQEPAELYRHYDRRGHLLYVGVSLSTLLRLNGHRDQSGWFAEIARVDIQRFPSRDEALRAETEAIKKEKPAHNLSGTGPRYRLQEQEWATEHEPVAVRLRTAAAMLGCSENTVRNLIKQGQLRTFKVGADSRVVVESIKALSFGRILDGRTHDEYPA